ncbi:hypothetical protein OF83DRAFT_23436 [Amylostereum chailletii]|nr:hypothetical protein OF83DRAFT_23436 [Amylostereum chailletii]
MCNPPSGEGVSWGLRSLSRHARHPPAVVIQHPLCLGLQVRGNWHFEGRAVGARRKDMFKWMLVLVGWLGRRRRPGNPLDAFSFRSYRAPIGCAATQLRVVPRPEHYYYQVIERGHLSYHCYALYPFELAQGRCASLPAQPPPRWPAYVLADRRTRVTPHGAGPASVPSRRTGHGGARTWWVRARVDLGVGGSGGRRGGEGRGKGGAAGARRSCARDASFPLSPENARPSSSSSSSSSSSLKLRTPTYSTCTL